MRFTIFGDFNCPTTAGPDGDVSRGLGAPARLAKMSGDAESFIDGGHDR